jgi:hypothetical protein
MKKIILSTLISTTLFATTYTLIPGWNLLGTISEIPVSQILANPAVRNVVIYRNGGYESSASNGITTIPEKNGFFVYTDSSTTVEISDGNPPSSTLQHLDGDLNPTEDATWAILKVVDANLLVEMKTSTYNAGLTYNHDQAISYCQDLTVGSVTGWRLPEIGELEGLSNLYQTGNENDFIIRKNDPTNTYYWSSDKSDMDDILRMNDGRVYDSHYHGDSYVMCVKNP